MADAPLRRTFPFPTGAALRPLIRGMAPATAAVLLLAGLGRLPPAEAVAAWLVAFAVAVGLALRRLRRTDEAGAYVEALMAGDDPGPPPDHLIDDDPLFRLLPRLRRALAEQRRGAVAAGGLDGLRGLFEAVDDPLLLVDRRRRVILANAAANGLFRAPPEGAALINAVRHPGLLAAVKDVLAAGRPTQLTLTLLGGPARAFAVRVAPLRGGALGEAAVVTFRERTEALQIERIRSDFVANASHEIRTPLTAIRGFIETLQGPARHDAPARERFLAIMAGEAERMGRLVEHLLSLSRIELAEHQPPKDRIDPGPVLGRVIDSLQPAAAKRGVRLVLRAAGPSPSVAGDADQLAQVFANLIDNAVVYGGDGGEVVVEAGFEEEAPPGAGPLTGRPAFAVAVVDRGEGIAAEHLPRLTERFFRVDASRSRRQGGTGLGLAIVKHILRRHQGHLAVASRPGAGSRFTVYLPADRRPEPAA